MLSGDIVALGVHGGDTGWTRFYREDMVTLGDRGK